MNSILIRLARMLALAAFLGFARDAFALGQTPIHRNTADAGALFQSAPALRSPRSASDTNDWPGVLRAAGDLRADIQRVSGLTPAFSTEKTFSGSNVILIGTVGKSEIIDRLVREKKIDVSPIAGKWESYFLQVVPNPFPGVENALVICGSDKRGTIYGIYDLSEQIGVSPWYYWADVPPQHHDGVVREGGKI